MMPRHLSVPIALPPCLRGGGRSSILIYKITGYDDVKGDAGSGRPDQTIPTNGKPGNELRS